MAGYLCLLVLVAAALSGCGKADKINAANIVNATPSAAPWLYPSC